MELDVEEVEELIRAGKEDNDLITKINEKKVLECQEGRRHNLVRYLSIVVDLSCFSKINDFKPTRLQLVVDCLCQLANDFIKQNPLSQLSLLVMHEGICTQRVPFTIDSFKIVTHLRQLQSVLDSEISFQNLLLELQQVFKSCPLYAYKEALVIQSTNNSKDHGDIMKEVDLVRQLNVVVNIISLGGQMQLCQQIANQTQGRLHVALDNPHLRQLISQYVQLQREVPDSLLVCVMVPVAFPKLFRQHPDVVCSCCVQLQQDYYECPVCHAFHCQVPSKCNICQVGLITHHDIKRKAQSYNQTAIYSSSLLQQSLPSPPQCFGCAQYINDLLQQMTVTTQCHSCQNTFCIDCDLYIRKTLFNCPGCL